MFHQSVLSFLFILGALTLTSALYSSNSDVIQLTSKNFDSLVLSSDDIWIVEFYAPWCGHCQQFAPEFQKAAKVLKGIVKVGAVNADEEGSLGGNYGVRSFPTVKIFAADKKKPEDYNGGRTAQALADAAVLAIKNKINAKLGGKQSGSGSKSGSDKDVIELTDSNFDKLVLQSDDMWLVEFFAPWCGHCKNLAPHWAEAATELKGKVKLGALDATTYTSKAAEYEVKGYPTIKYFPAGKKDHSSVQDYDGGRTGSSIVNWALEKLAENIPAPELVEITNEAAFKENCDKPLCVISVLPHILDCQSKCRNNYLKILQEMGEKFKKKMWGWLWTEAGAQRSLEDALDIGGFGYPAMAVVNAKKLKYSILRGPFSTEGISEFLRDLSYGRGNTAPLKGAQLPNIESVDPWDGKDGEFPTEEDIDLSDISLDEKDEL
ncbi:protein disulfide-isomerase A6 homolog [Agrilus planipennis]|uniref:Protein disulfide-isomerase A6 homolog n=1 Tax=Agrilus planipennis TaxID=224129 RepID=A0A7F5R3N9_AGRPL|nr:protein disulfide-isomerase A6 homolog [Agrilus planipennis]XP_025830282.1 protein disulfide-isomerase A6 homolog [Agrilus planipennis]